MRKILLLLCTAFLSALGAQAESKSAYGVLAMDSEDYRDVGALVSFPVEGNVTDFTREVVFGRNDVFAGAYADGTYYAVSHVTSSTSGALVPDKLLSVDLNAKTYKEIGTLSGFAQAISDMTYDNTGKVMYAVSKIDGDKSALYTIGLTDAKAEKKVDLDRKFFTLAANYSGELYGIDYSGNFCKIDKTTGKVTEVGATGFQPTYNQSMEFDHGTKTLHWAAVVRTTSGSMVLDESFMATIDVETGKATRLGNFGTDAQLVGLYIPFVASADGAPSAVLNLKVTPSTEGTASVAFSWDNPSLTFAGKKLDKLTKIDVYADGKLVHTLSNPEPGKHVEFDLQSETTNKKITYKVVPYNEAGEGIAQELTVYVGKDVPSAPFSLTVKRDSYNSATISWKAPTTGLNGSSVVDWATLSYNVVRKPDNKVLVEDGKALTFTDKDVATLDRYTYEVTAKTADGEGGKAETESVLLGPALTVPYKVDFNDAEKAKAWSAVDHDDDGNTWVSMSNPMIHKNTFAYKTPEKMKADDYLVSHVMQLEAGKTYVLSSGIITYAPADFRFVLLQDGDVEKPVKELKAYTGYSTNWSLKTDKFLFTVDKSGLYNLGLKAESAAGTNYLWVSTISIEESLPVNLTAESLTGNSKPRVAAKSTYTVKVRNSGTESVAAYTVNLKDATAGTVLATTAVNEALAPETTKDVTVEWTPESTDVTSIVGEVVAENDGNAADNATEAFEVTVAEKDPDNLVRIGDSSTTTATAAPFDFNNKTGAALNVYAQSEINRSSGNITRIAYPYQYSGSELTAAVKVYAANTELAKAPVEWIPEADMTLVYDGPMVFSAATDGLLEITFSEPFAYTGKNLALLTTVSSKFTYGYKFRTYISPLEGNGSITWSNYSATTPFDFTQTGKAQTFNSSVLLYIDPVSGVDAPEMAGVKVYPNPASNYLTVEGTFSALELLDMGGRSVARYDASASTIDVSGVADGLYLLVVTDVDNTRKVVKVSIKH